MNLAMTISQEIQRKAILIDGDIRKPGIYLEKSYSSKGLSHYLSDGVALSEILIETEMENLHLIQAGASVKKIFRIDRFEKNGRATKIFKGIGRPYVYHH